MQDERQIWRAAAESGDPALVRDALKSFYGSRVVDEDALVLMMRAAIWRGYVDVIQQLVDRGMSTNVRFKAGGTPIAGSTWVRCDRAMVVEHLLANGALVDGHGSGSDDALINAIWYQNVDAIEALLAHGASRYDRFIGIDNIMDLANSMWDNSDPVASSRVIVALANDL